MDTDCIFCKIVLKQINAEIIYEDDNVLVFSDINPVSSIHKLVIPKKHVKDIKQIDDVGIIINIFDVIKKLVDDLQIDNFKIVVNNGDKLQLVKHLHFHLISGDKVTDKLI
ncbi:HIT domain-containing protein [Patescibacteria group bacterium]|nr:HIT domain-containing protein [Patescibacteria group bacterium]